MSDKRLMHNLLDTIDMEREELARCRARIRALEEEVAWWDNHAEREAVAAARDNFRSVA